MARRDHQELIDDADDPPRRVSGWLGALVVGFALVSALTTFLVLSGATPVARPPTSIAPPSVATSTTARGSKRSA